MRYLSILSFILFSFFIGTNPVFSQEQPCEAMEYQLSDYGLIRTFNLTSNQYDGLIYPSCGNYEGDAIWVEFQAPSSGVATIELFPGSTGNAVDDAAFDLWFEACGGLTILVGCYSDLNCGVEPMPAVTLPGLVPGGRYFIRMFQENGGTGTIDLRISDPLGTEFNLGGDAVQWNSGIPGQSCVELTQDENNELGCAWFPAPINFNNRFEINFDLYFGERDNNGADGIVFFFHSDGPNPGCSGSTGGELGLDGIGQSVYFEFDTWNNGNGDLADDHAEVKLDLGFFELTVMSPTPIGAGGNVEDGAWHNVRIIWDPADSSLEMWFDGVRMMRRELADFTQFFIGREIYWGVVASTGGATNFQRFCYTGITVTNSTSYEVNDEVTICTGDSHFAGGTNQTEAGEYIDVFMASNGCDSTVTTILSVSQLEPIFDETIQLACGDSGEIIIDISNTTSDGTLSVNWSTQDGNIVSGGNTLTPTVDAAGTYNATLIDLGSGCSEGIEVVVVPPLPPLANASDGRLSCGGTLTLNGLGSIGVGDLEYIWTTVDGNIIADENTATPTVDAPGTYILVITDMDTNCESEYSVVVDGESTVDAGEDILVCEASLPLSTPLDGEVNGSFYTFEWQQSTGLDDPTILSPTANVTSPTSYELVATARVGANLVLNGNFESGDAFFTTEYESAAESGIRAHGYYEVLSDPSDFIDRWDDCSDHTGNNGQMLIIDSSDEPSLKFWCQTIEVKPNTDYAWSLWIQNVCSDCIFLNPEIFFEIDDVIVYQDVVNENSCEWGQLSYSWNSGMSTSVEFCFSTDSEEIDGNNFAIDDIELYELCEIRDEVEIRIDEFDVLVFQPTINCFEGDATFLANVDDNGNFSYQWTTIDGTIISDADTNEPVIMGEGTYTLVVTNEDNGCTSTQDITPLTDYEQPTAMATGGVITCDDTSITITGLGSTDSNATYEWVTTNGSIVSGQTEIDAVVDGAGMYELIVTSNSNGCTSSFTVEVTTDENTPNAQIEPATSLTCTDLALTLDASQTDSGTDIIYEWTTTDGTIVDGDDGLMPNIEGIGTYQLVVTNTTNGCTATSSITIEQEIEEPEFSIIDPAILTCINLETEIFSDHDNGNYEFEWTTADGNILSGMAGESINVDQTGTYSLTITNLDNGCTSTQSINVTENIAINNFTIDQPNDISCSERTVSIVADGNPQNNQFEWVGPNGEVLLQNGNTISATETGVYQVTITNPDNGCTVMLSTEVFDDLVGPTAEAGDEQTLGCDAEPIQLNGYSVSSNISISWTTSGGNIISGADGFNPEVNAPGTYTIVITNLDNGCTAEDEVIIGVDNNAPVADAGPDLEINCLDQTVMLDANNSSTGQEFTFVWSTMDGNIVTGSDGFNPIVDQAGTYTITILNNNNGCETISSVLVTLNNTPPNVEVGMDQELNCDLTAVELGNGNMTSPDFNYTWTTSNGNIVGAPNGASIIADQAGTYTLTIIDQNNGCENSSEVMVTEDNLSPALNINGEDFLSCDVSQLVLEGETDAPNVSYNWTTLDGSIISTTDANMISVDSDGIYDLEVINLDNGCSSLSSFEVFQDSDVPEVDILDPGIFTCDINDLELFAQSFGFEDVFQWSTDDGQIQGNSSVATINIVTAGTYSVTVTNTINNCTTTESITVEENVLSPVFEIQEAEELSCTVEMVALIADDLGADYIYEWSANPGNIVSGANELSPTVDQPGIYTLTVTSLDNNCSSSVDIQVEQDADSPIAMIEQAGNLDCAAETVLINALGSSDGGSFTYIWTTDTGNFLEGEDSLMPLVDAGGTYTLTIVNNDNNCEISTSVTIEEDIETPTADAGVSSQLDCDNPTLFLDGSLSSDGDDLIYQWSSPDGNIINGEDGLFPEIDEPGVYTLLISNSVNNCQNSAEVIITENKETPTLNISPVAELNCLISNVNLEATVSNPDPSLNYEWTTLDGNIVSGESTLTPNIDLAGTYTLTVVDPANGCSTSETIDVSSNGEIPSLEVPAVDPLSCEISSAMLNSMTNTNGLEYLWTTDDGVIIGDATQENLNVEDPGTYTLTITDPTNQCTNEVSVVVESNEELPSLNADVLNVITCIEEEATIDLSGSDLGSQNELTYTGAGDLIFDDVNQIYTATSPGVYEVTLTNPDNGCSSTIEILVEENVDFPLLSITEPQVLTCEILYTTLNANVAGAFDLEYNWTTIDGLIDEIDEGMAVVSEPGSYNVIVLNSENGCEETLMTTVLSDREIPEVDAGNGFEINCNFESGALDGEVLSDGNFTADWYTSLEDFNSGMNAIPNEVNSPGVYYFGVVDNDNGCSAFDIVEVTKNENIPTEIVSDIMPPLCFGDQGGIEINTVLGGDGPYLFSLDGEDFGSEELFENLESGQSYIVSIQDINGCELDTLLTIPTVDPVQVNLIPEVELSIGDDFQIVANTNIPPNEIAEIIWTPTEYLSCSDCLNPIVTPQSDILYTVIIKNDNGCSEMAEISFRVERDINIYVPTAFSPFNEDGINDVFTIYSGANKIQNINSFNIYDRWGNKVLEQLNFLPNQTEFGWDGTYRAKKMQPGVYVWWAEIELINGETILLEGDVTLVN